MTPTPAAGISVTLLAKNCAKALSDCLDSLKLFIRPDLGDELIVVDTGSTDDTPDVARSFGARVFLHPELNKPGMLYLVQKHLPEHYDTCLKDPQFKDGFLSDFAAARTLATSYAKNDIIFWIDADDVLVGGSEFRKSVADYLADPETRPENTCLFLSYDYSFDDDGLCNTVLWRERILDRRHYTWRGACHETMIPKDNQPQLVQRIPAALARIVHKHGRHHLYSDIRNYAILREAHNTAASTGDWIDPRWEFYLGNSCRGLSKWDECVSWYCRVLRRSGSRDDRLSCALNIAFVHLLYNRPWKSIDWFFQAIKIHPAEPRSYFGIARAYYELKRYHECLLYTQIGESLPCPEQITSVDPNHYDFYPNMFAALAHKELGHVTDAMTRIQRGLELRPNFPAARELARDISTWAGNEKLKSAAHLLVNNAASFQSAVSLIHSIKPELRKRVKDLQVETFCTPPRRSITFLTGTALEDWDPTREATGIGGSEKMVIQLARRFAAAGYRVDVYGNPLPGNEYKTFDGVTYRPVQSFNPLLERGIVIVWRRWPFLDAPIKARKLYLDCHDVQNPHEATPDRLKKLSGVFFKSAYHAQVLRDAGVPSDKFIITRNGIDLAAFPALTPEHAQARNLNKIVLASSADRGLARCLRIFERLKSLHPAAEFHVYYGFVPTYYMDAANHDYRYLPDCGAERHMLDYAEECFDTMHRLGAVYHGRVGHRELADELRTASVALYPTEFPEISCMAAMEAQAAGCLPVMANRFALTETVKYGTLLDPTDENAYVAAVSGLLTKGHDLDTYRQECSDWARKTFDNDALAADWLKHFES